MLRRASGRKAFDKLPREVRAITFYAEDGGYWPHFEPIVRELTGPMGRTITYLQEILRARGPRVLRIACLLDKPSRRKVEVRVDYVGFTIEDKFVVGYGLDYAEQYRNLPYIGVIEV